jgi:phage terminase small subunit
VANGDGNATKAARDAGYSNSSAHAVGYRLLRMQPVVDAIQRHTAMQIGPLAPQALRTMAALLSAKSEFVRQTAAADLLDRAGFKPPERHKLSVTGGVTIDIKLTD